MTEPKVRFPEFTGEWDIVKLNQIAERVIRKNFNNECDLPLTISAQMGLIDQKEFYDKRIASKDVSGYYLIKNGEFAYNKSTSLDAPFGAIKRLDRYDQGVLSTLYIVFKINDESKINSDFLSTYYDTEKWYREIKVIAVEGSRAHGLLNITPSDFFGTRLLIPHELEEQQKIGSFFSKIDNFISLNEEKLTELRNLKKSLMQKMFPKDGEAVPEIRFPGFDGEWEEKELHELGDITTGSTPSTKKSEYYSENGIPWVTPTDIQGCTISNTPRKLSEEGAKVGRVVPENTILCTCIASIGKNTLLIVEGSFNQQINGLTPNEENDAYFLLTESEIWSKQMKQQAAGGIAIVNKTEFSKIVASVPKLEEQQKIGSFFKELDNRIELQKQKLNEIKEYKKGLLQQMFC